MAHQKFDLVQETSTSTGTGAIALAGAVTRRRRFGDVLSNADTCYVLIEHGSAAEWEICLATWNTGHTLTRGAVLASSTGSAVSFSSGTKTVTLVAPASKSVVMDNNGDATVTRDLTLGRSLFVATGLGIGRSPGYALDVNANIGRLGDGSTGYALFIFGMHATATNNWHCGSNGDGNFIWFNGNFGAGTARLALSSAGHVTPAADNTQTMGSASFRWSVVYAGTGTINTSGAESKDLIGDPTDAERRAASRILAIGPRRYKFRDAIEKKGEAAARWHFGYVAEDVRDALEAEGLDPWAYGFICADPIMRTETYTEKATRPKVRKVQAVEKAVEIRDGRPVLIERQVERDEPVGTMVPVVGEDGRPVMTAGKDADGNETLTPMLHFVPELEEYDAERSREVETGETRLGLRYSELEAFLRCAA